MIAPGKRADVAVWDMTGIEAAGSWDPAALLLAGPMQVEHLFVEGRPVVHEGRLVSTDLHGLQRDQARLLAKLQG